jgi:hypothetical protein
MEERLKVVNEQLLRDQERKIYLEKKDEILVNLAAQKFKLEQEILSTSDEDYSLEKQQQPTIRKDMAAAIRSLLEDHQLYPADNLEDYLRSNFESKFKTLPDLMHDLKRRYGLETKRETVEGITYYSLV